jgi:hypothetical protein
LSFTSEEGGLEGKNLRRGAAASVLAFVFALVLAGSAAGVLRTYQDTAGESYQDAMDILTVTASDESAGNFIIDVVENYQDIHNGDQLTVYLNTDRNRNDNDGGAEYALFINGTGTGTADCGLFHWNGTQYVLVQSLDCPFFLGPTFTFSRAQVGNPADFEFWMYSEWVPTHERDYAPDNGGQGGWWLFDPTPPDTAITGGPSGSTTETTASFTFTSTEGGSFQCSLDGSAFTGCGSPASYGNLGFGTHTFQVRAIDSSGNVDPSAAARSWTVVDGAAPTAKATTGRCCDAKGQAKVEYQINDNSGRASAVVTINRPGGRVLNTCPFGMDQVPRSYAQAPCKVPTSARGWLKFCVRARDAAGNTSAPSCRRLKFGRLYTDAHGAIVPVGGGLKIASFTLSDLNGGKPSLRYCGSGCKPLRQARGTIIRPGARLEIRVVKPRIRGVFIAWANIGGRFQRTNRCLPPGLAGPVISCRKTS